MFRRLFLTGLSILLPILITYKIFLWFVHILTNPFHDFVQGLLIEYRFVDNNCLHYSAEQATYLITKLLIIFSLLSAVLLLGIISHFFLLKFLVFISDAVVGKIPIVGSIYKASKDLTTALFSKKSDVFSQVVLVPYPSHNQRAIGFISGSFENRILPEKGKELISVFVPGTPNPTIGFVLLYAKDDITFIDMSVSDAVRMIMSCGTATLQK